MITRNGASALALAMVLAGSASYATAQTPAPLNPESPPAISLDQARRIAAEHGVVRIEEIELDDGKWEIEGRDSMGGEIDIDLSASDGSVLKIDRERPAAARANPG